MNTKILLLALGIVFITNLSSQTLSKQEMIVNRDLRAETVTDARLMNKAINEYYLTQAFLKKYEKELTELMNTSTESDAKNTAMVMDVKKLSHTEYATKYHLDDPAFISFLEDTGLVVATLTFLIESERANSTKTK